MNRKQPYEEVFSRKVDDLPLPDEDEAWQKMKAILDAKKDRRPVFYWRWIAGLFLCFVLAGVVVIEMQMSGEAKQSIVTQTKVLPQPQQAKSQQILNHGTKHNPEQSAEINLRVSETNFGKTQIDNQKASKQDDRHTSIDAGKTTKSLKDDLFAQQNRTAMNVQQRKRLRAGNPSINNLQGLPGVAESLSDSRQSASENKEFSKEETGTGVSSQSANPQQNSLIKARKTATENPVSDAQKSPDNFPDNKSLFTPPIVLKPKARLFSVGIAVQHPLQFSGQDAVAYGYNAGSQVSDYIPSVWLRYERPKRWFFHGEFIYSAPQLVKEFAFSRQTKADTGFNSITTVLRMKKTFFNQIPISFNYYVKPNWSIGGGVGYAWLKGAITQRDVIRNTSQGQILAKREIIPVNGFTDSFLYRSHSLVLLQTEYKLNRLSAGIKFTRDLQSFITYTAPDGRLIDKKNSALSVVLRFKLWEQ